MNDLAKIFVVNYFLPIGAIFSFGWRVKKSVSEETGTS